MPGGVNSPVRAFANVGRTPVFISRAKGSKIYDEDSNEYIDYVGSWGPAILGHAREEVISAVKCACDRGLSFGAATAAENELARLIIDAVKGIEMVRLVNSGTEAVMSALRVARGYTGRDLVLKFEGCYHGHSDGLLVKAGSGLLTGASPDSAGVPSGYSENTLIASFNDFEQVEQLFESFGENIACVIVEPVAANMGVVNPKEGFLRFLRSITEKYGSLLIFDEVITGFRLSYGGAGEFFSVTPDMTVLGKIVGGGMPLGAYGGRWDIMQVVSPLGGVYQAGTLSGNPIAVTAGIETLKLLRSDKGIYSRIDDKAAEIEQCFLDNNITVNRAGSLLSPFFTDCPVETFADVKKSDLSRFSRYFSRMLDSGIYIAPSQFEAMFVSDALTKEDIEKTRRAIDYALQG